MYAGLAVSLGLHLAVLFWAFVSMQATPKLDVPDVPTIEAELITISEFTRLKQGDPNAKKLEAKAKEKPKTKTAKKEAPKPKPELAPPPAQEPPPKSDPIADKIAALTPPPPSPEEVKKKLEAERKAAEKKKADDKAKADAKKKADEAKKKKAESEKKRKAAAKKKAEAERKRKAAEKKRKAKKKKKKDFAVAMKALLDKTPEKRGAPRSATEPTNPTDYTGPTAGERQGSGTQLTAREEDLLKSRIDGQLRSCWRLPGGGGGIETTIVVLSWRMNKDGSLNGQPKIVNRRNDPVFNIAAEAAIRAVNCAAPFSLPQDKFESWKTITDWKFDPSAML